MRVRVREQRVVNALFVNEEGGTKTKRPGAFCAESAEDYAASLFEESVGTENNDPRHARQTRYFARAESAIWMGGFR